MNKFSQDIEQVLLPLKGSLNFDLIKTENELMLTYAIMIKDYHIQNLENSANESEEPKQFINAKANMIKWLEILRARDDIFKEADYDALISELTNIELIERVTTTETVKKKMWRQWHKLYTDGLGVGKDRASAIVKGIEKWVLHINPLIHKNRKDKDIEKFNTTIKNTNKDFHNKSIELYNLLDTRKNEEEETTNEAKVRAKILTKAIIRREKQRQKRHD